MLFQSQVITKASGSVGGLTASHNRYGQYMRARSTPVNPNTAKQVVVRSALASLSAIWQTLTGAQRIAWADYAANVPVLNKLGETVNLTGFNMYLRSNIPRLQAGLARVDDGPTVFSLPELTDPVPTVTVAAGFQSISLAFTNTDPWANENGGAMLIYAAAQVAPSINFFKGPFTFQDTIDGDGVTPPTSPDVTLVTQLGTVGNKAHIAVRATRADGRLSSQRIIPALIG